MGPHDFTCPEAEIDFRVGGAYRAMIKSEEHGENWFSGVYREIDKDKRIVFTFAWDNDGPSASVRMSAGHGIAPVGTEPTGANSV